MNARPRVRIIHQTNPTKYFPAILELAESGDIELVGTHRYSVVKEWLRSGIKDRRPLRQRSSDAWSDLKLRLRLRARRGEVIVLGCAPWDWRMLIYRGLAKRNVVVYHTSWYDWRRGPRRYGPLTPMLRTAWLRFLRQPGVRVVSVLEAGRDSLYQVWGVDAVVIPHAVPGEFFQAAADDDMDRPLRLLYVGELSVKKGVQRLLDAAPLLRAEGVDLTVVGDGVLRDACQRADQQGDITFLGPILGAENLAPVVADHDVLALLSHREGNWQELFGIVLIEAMAAGLGVIATDHIGPMSVLEGRDLGNLFAEDDDHGPWNLILALAADHGLRASFKIAHRGIADQYRSDAVALQWREVLRSATNRQGHEFHQGSSTTNRGGAQ